MKRGSWSFTETGGLSVSPRVGSRREKPLGDGPRLGGYPQNTSGNVGHGTLRRFGMDITWVVPDRIAVSGGIWNKAENMAAVSQAGITHIIDMQVECDDRALASQYGIEVCWIGIDDDFEPKPPGVFAEGVEFALKAFEKDDTKLLIHCAAGVHRAPMMALALLGVMGWTVEDGMDLIQENRPVADFAEVYVRSVEEFLKGRS